MHLPFFSTLFFLAVSTTGVLSASLSGDDLLADLLQALQDSQGGSSMPAAAADDAEGDYSLLYAGCDIRPDVMDISGSINLRQKTDGTLDIFLNVTGFDNDDYFVHGLHVHEYGDFSDGCTSFGSHYNPYGTNHGAKQDPADSRHLGDWGNIEEDGNGNILEVVHDWYAKLEGVNSIAGRGIVIHEHGDDLGRGGTEDSLSTGNSGTRLGCCVIYYNEGLVWQGM